MVNSLFGFPARVKIDFLFAFLIRTKRVVIRPKEEIFLKPRIFELSNNTD